MKVSERYGVKFEVYTLEELKEMTRELCERIILDGFRPGVIIGLGRGGWPVLRYCSDFLDVSNTYTLRVEYYAGVDVRRAAPRVFQDLPPHLSLEGVDVLLVDDVLDTSETMSFVRDKIASERRPKSIRIGVLHYKPWARLKPDYYVRCTSSWIVYDWERCETIRRLLDRHRLLERFGWERVREDLLEIGFTEMDLKMALYSRAPIASPP